MKMNFLFQIIQILFLKKCNKKSPKTIAVRGFEKIVIIQL
jgi:hypothetical protein